MFYKTISKNSIFVISLLFLSVNVLNCTPGFSENGFNATQKEKISDRFKAPEVVGKIGSSEITESSGLAASRCNEDVFWTHNDSKNDPLIFALDKEGGRLGTWKVEGAENIDWEDMAAFKDKSGECYLFIGDIGNNARFRSSLTVYRVKEPRISKKDSSSSEKDPLKSDRAAPITLSFPDFPFNSETLLVHPKTEDIYIVSKMFSGSAAVYKLPAASRNGKNVLVKVADFSVPAIPGGLFTGGEISSDGRRVILCDYYNGYEISLPDPALDFDEIWKEEPTIIDLGKREQGEAICYSVDMSAVFATSEKKNSPFIKVERK